MGVVAIKELLEAGVHFGHQTNRWNPKMKRFLFGERNGVYIIDLQQTVERMEQAYAFARDTVAAGDSVLFVGTKRQAAEILEEEAKRANQFYINQRWLGGMLTNFKTVKGSLKKLKDMQAVKDAGMEQMIKKEALLFDRELAKLEKDIGGIQDMNALPDALFVIDVGYHKIAVAEARKLLTEAGIKPGAKVKFTYNTSEYHKKMAIFAASEWKTKLGLDTEMDNLEFKVLIKKRHDGDYQIGRHGWVADYNDVTTFLTLVQCDSDSNDSKNCNRKAEELINQGNQSMDPAKRKSLLTQAAKDGAELIDLWRPGSEARALAIIAAAYPEPQRQAGVGREPLREEHQRARPLGGGLSRGAVKARERHEAADQPKVRADLRAQARWPLGHADAREPQRPPRRQRGQRHRQRRLQHRRHPRAARR